MPGCFSRNSCDVLRAEHLVDAAVALPEDHAAALRSALRCCRRARRRTGSQTGIWSSVMPMPRAVLRPRCWSGKNITRLVRANDQSSAALALLDVQTMPPCRPTNALRLAAELMYVTGVMSLGVDHFAELVPGVFDLVDRRPCRPSSSRRPCRAGSPARARRRARPASPGGWPGCRPSRP